MSEKKRIEDGGPAFPRPIGQVRTDPGSASYNEGQRGMSLRDWLAGMALSGILAAVPEDQDEIQVADIAYRMADAMLAARKGGAR